VLNSRKEDNRRDPANLIELLEDSSSTFKTKKAMELRSEDELIEISYQELMQHAVMVAEELVKIGIQSSDRVAILSENRPEWAIAYFGILVSNAVAVPLDIRHKEMELAYILNDCEARAVFISRKYFPLADNLRKSCRTITFFACLDDLLERGKPAHMSQCSREVDHPRGAPSDVAMIVYTSGSTGLPKGVELTHSNLLFEVKAFRHILSVGTKDRILSVLPLNHALELICGLLGPLHSGASIVYVQNLRPDAIIGELQRTNPTIVTVVPLLVNLIYRSLLKKIHQGTMLRKVLFRIQYILFSVMKRIDIHAGRSLFDELNQLVGGALRCFICGGAPLDSEIAGRLDLMGITVLQGYGLTEAAPIISANTFDNNKIGSVGKPLPGIEVRIVKEREADTVGEIAAKGPNVMKGYLNERKRTDEVIRDGWLYTGDIGYMDREGYLFVTGRSKSMIVTAGGKKVQPEEIERLLLKSPYIKEVCVVGKRAEGLQKGGEEVYAVIVPDLDYLNVKADFSEVTDAELRKIIAGMIQETSKGIADYKTIAGFELWREELPKTSTGKIRRDDIARQINQKI